MDEKLKRELIDAVETVVEQRVADLVRSIVKQPAERARDWAEQPLRELLLAVQVLRDVDADDRAHRAAEKIRSAIKNTR